MTRDGYREYSISQMREMATCADRELDGRHGDPSKCGNWIRERRLAWMVLVLIARIDACAKPVEIREP